MTALNQRQLDFVRHYVAGADGVVGNATRSAEAAGYAPKNAALTGHRLLRNAKIAVAVDQLRAKAQNQTVAKLRDWNEMVPDAQRVIEVVMLGGAPVKKADAMRKAANDILDRALGKVPTRMQVSGELTIDTLLKETDDDRPGG